MLKSVLRNGGEIMRKLDTVLLSEDNRIKFLRKSRHLTLRELGKILDIPDNSLSQYENGKRKTIPKDVLIELAEYFDVSVEYLMGRTLTKIDIIKNLNDNYILDKENPFYLGDKVRYHLNLLALQLPENIFEQRDFSDFTPRIQHYWEKNFDFLFVCDSIKAILNLDKVDITNSEIKYNIETEIKEVDYILTSTKISKSFNKIVENKLFNFGSKRKDLMRFADKETIKFEIFNLEKALYNFLDELDDLPNNTEKQYTSKIANKRLKEFIRQKSNK